jgi:CRP/FNR family transcriptional regulator, anaerobic regulatory protein
MGSLVPAATSILPAPPVSRPWLGEPSQPSRPNVPPGEDAIETLRRAGQTIAVGRDETLFCEHEEADAVYVVVSGALRSSKMLPDGRRQIIGFHEAGDLVGMTLADFYPYSAEGVTEVRLRRVGRRQLEDLMEATPQLRQLLLTLAARELAAAQRQMLLLGRKTARERLCSFLLERAHGTCRRIELPMSRTDIADYLGLTIETVSRTLSQLRADGLIRMSSLHSLELADADRLGDVAEAA